MADFKYSRDTVNFFNLGMDLNRPIDRLKQLKVAIAKNIRSYQAGRVETRPGLTAILKGIGSHSIRRLNDPANSAYARITGHGTNLHVDGVLTDAGYSGNPLALQPYRPPQSPSPWMYVADSSRMRKVSRAGTVHQIGLPAPTAPPVTTVPVRYFYNIAIGEVLTGWSASGTGIDAITASAGADIRVPNTTTITAILYDVGSTGWCSIQPSSLENIGEDNRIIVDTTKVVYVAEVHQGSPATTIAKIVYDSGTDGDCSIVFTNTYPQFEVGGLLSNTTIGEYALITSTTVSEDGSISVRCSTPNTWAATNAILAVPSFRTYSTTTLAATNTLYMGGLTIRFTGDALSACYVQKDLSASPINLTSFASGVPITADDYIHLSIRIERPDRMLEGKLMFDVSNSATFAKDYYYKTFTVNDLTPNISSEPITLTSTLEKAKQSEFAYLIGGLFGETLAELEERTPETFEALRTNLRLGNTWMELKFRVGDLIRVGTNTNATLASVYYIRLQFSVDSNDGTDWYAFIHSYNIYGGGGLNSGARYLYRYRARCSTTGAVSNWSPATLGGVYLRRHSTYIAAAAQYTAATEADYLDFQRYGGNLPQWHYTGTVANSAVPTSLYDKTPDDVLIVNPTGDQTNYQPWPILGVPVSGATAAVSGISVTSTADFSTSWAPGTNIQINNRFYSIYRVVSTSLILLNENAGSAGVVTFSVPEPIIISQPLPCFWGPLEDTFFACGDTVNPGRLYWTNQGDADSTRLAHTEGGESKKGYWMDITTPSEPLQNGCIYNGRCYVFSTERMFQITPTGDNYWTYLEIPNGKGMFSRWALTGLQSTSGPAMFWLGKNGIYASDGGTPASLTDDDLRPLFPIEGNLGETVNTIVPPNIVTASAPYLRLSFYDDHLYFDYIDTNDDNHTLVHVFNLMEGRGGWFYDTYTPSILLHYGEEGDNIHSLLCGGSDGTVYQFTGTSDAGSEIACQIRTAARDQGDSRYHKLYGDIMLDANTNSVDVTATPYFNNHVTAGTATTINTATRLQTPFDVHAGSWYTARNISLDLTWSTDTGGQEFFTWEPRWHEEGSPIIAYSWEICESNFGKDGFLYTGDMYLAHISTANLTLTFTVDGTAQTPIAITHSGGDITKDYIRLPVMKGKLFSIRLSSTSTFRVHGKESELRVKQWGANEGWTVIPMYDDLVAAGQA